MKITRYISVLAVLAIFSSCKNETKETTPEVKTVETTQQKSAHTAGAISAEFDDAKLQSVFTAYVALKTALVNTDAKKASAEASNLMTALANIGVEETTLKAAQNVVETDDVEVQRAAFVIITKEVEQMMEGAIASGVVYKQYCPMAFNNTGAYWLSESKEIRNPYFGDKMLKCGRIEAEIK